MSDKHDLLSQPLSILQLSVRAFTSLQSADVHTVGDLCNCTAEELLEIDHFGDTTLLAVQHRLAEHQLSLRNSRPNANPAATD